MSDVAQLPPSEAMHLAETAEAEFMYAFEAAAPDHARSALGMSQARVGGGVMLVMANDPTGGYWNKALGFGITEPVTDDLVADVVGRYRSAAAPAGVLQIAPAALPDDWDDICGRLGIREGSVWAKLLRPADLDPEPATTDLDIRPVDITHADEYAHVFAEGFGMPQEPSLMSVFAHSATSDGFTAYGAWDTDTDTMVAGAQLHIVGPAAAFCGAATLESARRRGAQSAFMHRRLTDARAARCAWMSAETWQESDGQHNPSLHNMERAGFVQVYDRRNWVWPGA